MDKRYYHHKHHNDLVLNEVPVRSKLLFEEDQEKLQPYQLPDIQTNHQANYRGIIINDKIKWDSDVDQLVNKSNRSTCVLVVLKTPPWIRAKQKFFL